MVCKVEFFLLMICILFMDKCFKTFNKMRNCNVAVLISLLNYADFTACMSRTQMH